MVPFAGWEMPVQYTGVIPEHLAVRADAGAFDVSHMGQLHVDGPTAQSFLQSVLSNDVDRVQDRHGRTIYRNDTRVCAGCQVAFWNNQPVPVVPSKGVVAVVWMPLACG